MLIDSHGKQSTNVSKSTWIHSNNSYAEAKWNYSDSDTAAAITERGYAIEHFGNQNKAVTAYMEKDLASKQQKKKCWCESPIPHSCMAAATRGLHDEIQHNSVNVWI